MSEDSIERDGIKWGAPIEGDMPKGLDPMDPVRNKYGVELNACAWMERYAPYQLPADHPYYAQEKRKEIDPALVERMVALVRSAANGEHISAARAKSIIGEIEPIDPDLIEARLCVVKAYESIGRKDLALQADSGKMDNRLRVQACLAAIKRGRELETKA